MALKNKLDETKLRSLTYGDNSPYITVDVVTQKVSTRNKQLSVSNNGNRLNSSIIDTARVKSFLEDKTFWGVRQISSQAMNAKSNFGYINGISIPLFSSDQLYTPLNTISQVALTGIGSHIQRKGEVPGGLISSILGVNTYEEVKKQEKLLSGPYSKDPLVLFSNKLLKLDKIGTSSLLPQPKKPKTFFGKLLSNLVNLLPSPKEPIYSYLGGPNSKGGLGITTIRRYYNSIDEVNNPYYLRGFEIKSLDRNETDLDFTSGIRNGTKINYSSLLGASNIYSTVTSDIIDNHINNNPFIQPSYLNQTQSLYPSTPISPLFNIFTTGSSYQGRIGTGSYYKYGSNNATLSTNPSASITYNNGSGSITFKSPGSGWLGISREVRVGSGKYDNINLTPLFTSNNSSINDAVIIDSQTYNIRDLVKFRIEAINTDTPTSSTWMVFRAFLTDLSDNINASWTGLKYIGRAENFYTYQGFERSVNIGFKVAALSKEEMQPMYNKLNYLQSNMMGDYKEGIMRGPFMKMTIGNWFDRQPGIITSLNYKVSNDSPWEIAMDEPEGGIKMLILPHIVEVSLTFIPIGAQTKTENQLPQKGANQSNIAQNQNDTQYIKEASNGKFTGFSLDAYNLK